MEENGGFMTEFWSSSNPDKENFVEETESLRECQRRPSLSNQRGGSLITANIITTTTEMFCGSGRVTDKYSQGCNNLIKHKKSECAY
jgi:DNA processing protein